MITMRAISYAALLGYSAAAPMLVCGPVETMVTGCALSRSVFAISSTAVPLCGRMTAQQRRAVEAAFAVNVIGDNQFAHEFHRAARHRNIRAFEQCQHPQHVAQGLPVSGYRRKR